MSAPAYILSGASGFLGRKLVKALAGRGDRVVVLSRDPERARGVLGERVEALSWDGRSARGWGDRVEGARAIINLAGESLYAGIWTKAKREAILRSRTDAGRAVLEAVGAARVKPGVLVQSSGVGYYGSRADELLPETASTGSGFLADVTRQWEESTAAVEPMGVRRVITRTGIVLARDGGALPPMALPFRFFVGGPIGRGRRWLSWIHSDDYVRAVLFLIDTASSRGVFNLAAPPVRESEMAKAISRALRRPCWFPAPAFILRAFLGIKARETVLVSQRILPERLRQSGFRFLYPDVGPALEDIYRPS